MRKAFSSSAWIHLDQSYSKPLQTGVKRPSTVSRSPSQTSASVNTYAGRRSLVAMSPGSLQWFRAGSHTENEPSACAYMTIPGRAGRPGLPIQLCSRRENSAPQPRDPPRPRTRNRMFDEFVASRGRAGWPDVMRWFTSRGHRRVSAHHATSSRKLLPRPLSPVTRFTRFAGSRVISAAGPTLWSARCSSIVLPGTDGQFSLKPLPKGCRSQFEPGRPSAIRPSLPPGTAGQDSRGPDTASWP